MRPDPDTDVERNRSRRSASTMVFAVATMFSRVAGMVRQMVVSALFGATTQLSAFTVAFQIPNLIRSLVADAALSAAFVPVFTELNESGERERAWRVASTFVTLIVLVLGPLTILAMLLAPAIVHLFVGNSSFSAADVELAVNLTRILMPIVLFMALSGVIVGILNAHDHFSTPAIAPIAWNAVILGALLIVVPFVAEDLQIYVYAIGVLVGTIVQALLPIPWLRGTGGKIRFGTLVFDSKVRDILLIMMPVTLSLGLINLQQLIDSAFSTRVPASLIPFGVELGAGPAILENAFRVYMLPQGVFSVAISTVFFPALARLATSGDLDGFRTTFADGLRQIFLLLLPSAAFLAVLAGPVVRLLYERGEFTASQTGIVGATLSLLAVGLVFNGASLLLIRAFFSLRSPWVPTSISLLILTLQTLLDFILYTRLGIQGIALATSAVNAVAFCTLYVLLRRRAGRLDTTRTLRTVLVALVASALAAGVAWLVWAFIDHELGRSTLAQLISMSAAFASAAGLYLLIVVKTGLLSTSTLKALTGRRTNTEQ